MRLLLAYTAVPPIMCFCPYTTYSVYTVLYAEMQYLALLWCTHNGQQRIAESFFSGYYYTYKAEGTEATNWWKLTESLQRPQQQTSTFTNVTRNIHFFGPIKQHYRSFAAEIYLSHHDPTPFWKVTGTCFWMSLNLIYIEYFLLGSMLFLHTYTLLNANFLLN